MRIRWRIWVFTSISLVLLLSVLGLISFFTSSEQLSSFCASFIPMAPLTAFCFIMLTLPLFFLIKTNLRKWELFVALMLSITVFLITFFGLAENFFRKNVNIEDYLLNVTQYLDGVPLFRMSPVTKIMFLLISVDVLVLSVCKGFDYKGKYVEYVTGLFTVFVLVGSYVFCVSYLYGKPLLYETSGVIPMAISTAFAFVFFSLAMLIIKKDQFPVRFLLAKTTHGILLRFILPLAILPILLIQVALIFTFEKMSAEPFFITVSLIFVIMLIVGWSAIFISRYLSEIIKSQEIRLIESKKILNHSEIKYRTLYESMIQGVIYQNSSGEIIDANPAARKILGLSTEELVGRTSFDSQWMVVDQNGVSLPPELHPAIKALKTGKAVSNFIMGVFNREKNKFIWIIVNAIPIEKGAIDNEDNQVFTTFLDITELKNANDEINTLKNNLELQVELKTHELNLKIAELENFYQATIDRELRMEELRQELEIFKRKETNE